MAEGKMEISIKGKWVSVPTIEIGGASLVVSGKGVRIAEIHDEDWIEGEVEDPEVYIRALKGKVSPALRADIFTFTQKLPNTEPRFSYPFEWDNVAAIGLTTLDDWLKGISSDTRRNVKTAAKRGVVTRVTPLDERLVRGIIEINNESAVRQGRLFHHYGKDFETVYKDYCTFQERTDFIGAYLEDELIAFMKIVHVGKIAAIMQNLSKISHHDKRAANALMAKAVETCVNRGSDYLTYIKYTYGRKRESSLTEFKRRNGFQEVKIPRYFVPLTAKGKVAMGLKLHKSLVDVLPEKVTYSLLQLRSKWHEWRYRTQP
jgi:hypothetical protein